jgi:uncharacterized membrane protein YvlD (DUF360 family)
MLTGAVELYSILALFLPSYGWVSKEYLPILSQMTILSLVLMLLDNSVKEINLYLSIPLILLTYKQIPFVFIPFLFWHRNCYQIDNESLIKCQKIPGLTAKV